MTQKQHKATGAGASQCAKIRAALEQRAGHWVAMTDLWRESKAFAVHSRISDLRKRGLKIDHRNEVQPDRSIHSFYRLTT